MKTLVTTFQDIMLDDGIHRGSRHQEYHYAYNGVKDVKAGDWALVHNGTEFGLVQVRRTLPGMSSKVRKVVMLVFTKADFDNYLEMNKQLAQRSETFSRLDEMLEEKKKMAKYEDLKGDPEAESLINFLQNFGQPTIEGDTPTNGGDAMEHDSSQNNK